MNGMDSKTIAARQKRLDELKKRIGAGMGIRAALADMGYTGKSAGQTYRQIRNFAQANDPEIYAILPEKISDADMPVETPETPTVKLDGPLKIETPEKNNVKVVETQVVIDSNGIKIGPATKPMTLDGLEVSAVRDHELGEFYYDHDHNCIDWRNPFGDEVSLGVNGWKIMAQRITKILNVLGVGA